MKKKKDIDKEVRKFIGIIAHSFHDSFLVYSYGGCYGFYEILKYVFPEAQPYFDDEEKDHVVTKIGNNFYDIKCDKLDIKPIKMTKEDMEYWKNVSHGQRIEFMVAKYNKMCKNYQKD